MRPPSPGEWRDRYGPRRNPVTGMPETHHGLDIGDDAGTLLVAPADARLISYGVIPGWEVHGRVARLADADGWEHWLSHTDRLVLDRHIGDRLDEGDPIAIQGMTGQTTGRHVHWETRLNGLRLDPEAWLARPQHLDPEPLPTPPTEKEDTMIVVIYPKGDTAAPKHIYDPEAGKIVRPVNGSAESEVLRALSAARPEACVFLEVSRNTVNKLLGK